MVASLEIGPDQGGCRSFRSVPAEQPKPRFICLALLVSCVLGIISNPAVSNPVPARRPQDRGFKLLTDHHVQQGPSFPKPADVLIDAAHGVVRTTDEAGKTSEAFIEMPADTYNGLASAVLMNLPAGTTETTIAIVIGGAKPRIAHLKSTIAGKRPFMLGGTLREATEWTVHVELGGIAKVIAPIIGKEPPDYHVLIGGGEDPVFLREVGPLSEGGPIWRVQQVSAVFPE